jgi:hypothetical protein
VRPLCPAPMMTTSVSFMWASGHANDKETT